MFYPGLRIMLRAPPPPQVQCQTQHRCARATIRKWMNALHISEMGEHLPPSPRHRSSSPVCLDRKAWCTPRSLPVRAVNLQHSRGDAAGSAHPSREARGTAPPASAPGSTGTLPLTDPVGGFGTREIVPGATTVHAGTVLLEEVVGFLWCPETGWKKEWAERGMSKGSTGTWGR